MATLEIKDCIARIKRIPERLADEAVEIMKLEINGSTHGTGHLASTVKKRKYADGTYGVGTNDYVGGGKYAIREVGWIIREGRPELWPRYGKLLKFPPPLNWDGPVSFDEDNVPYVTAKHAKAVKPNDFIGETVKVLRGYINGSELSDY